MTRTNPKLKRFASLISHTSEIAPQFAKRRLISLRRGCLPVILFLPVVMQLCAVSAAAQLSIVGLEKNRRRIALPTSEVTRISGTRRGSAQPIVLIPMSLEVGDELIGNTGAVAVKVRCNSAEAALSGKFRVRMLPSPGSACNLHFHGSAGARLNITASGPTTVVSGALTLGTRRTSYEIRIPEKRGGRVADLFSRGVMPTTKVFEGVAVVQSPLFSGAVKEGEKVAFNAIERISPQDILQAAEVYAGLDVIHANVVSEKELDAAYKKLRGLHSDVLENPGDESKLILLTRTQQELGVPTSDVGVHPRQSADSLKPESLKVNEKQIRTFDVDNGCRSAATWRLTVSKAPFVRLVSPADVVPRPGGPGEWKLMYDASGLQPGTYTGEIMVMCVDCANKQCLFAPRVIQVTLTVL